MDSDRNEPHFETDSARGGSTPHIVRWILAISLVAAIALLSVIWITGAATQSEAERHVEVSRAAQDRNDDTDSIVGQNADELETADPGEEPGDTPTVENEAADDPAAETEAGGEPTPDPETDRAVMGSGSR